MTAEANTQSTAGRLALVVIAAFNEEDRIGDTVTALTREFPNATIVVGDDGSTDGTAAVARSAGAAVIRLDLNSGKGQAATAAANAGLRQIGDLPADALVLLCDADLGRSAERFLPLIEPVASGQLDLAIAGFARRVGGGFGIALGFARWAIERRSGRSFNAPISGQRVLTKAALEQLVPFSPGFGMEIGMTVSAVRAGLRVDEVELDLAHRATGRTFAGFRHRARQLRDFIKVYLALRNRQGGPA